MNADTAKVDTSTQDIETTENPDQYVLDSLKNVPVTKKSLKLYYGQAAKGDDFSSDHYYQDKSSSIYVNRNGIFCTVQPIAPAGALMEFHIQYYADDWLFIKDMTFNVDGKNYNYSPDSFNTDNGDGMIWEWSSKLVDEKDLGMLVAIATGKKAKVKYEGSQYYKVVQVTKAQQAAILKMLKLYKVFFLKLDKQV